MKSDTLALSAIDIAADIKCKEVKFSELKIIKIL